MSVAVHVTRVVPKGNVSGALLIMVGILVISSAVELPRTATLFSFPEASTVTSSDMIRLGGVVSTTVTLLDVVAKLSSGSTTTQLTTVSPKGKLFGAS